MIEINGIAHISLTVRQFEKASVFYEKLLTFLGLQPVFVGEEMRYFVGGKTAVGIQKSQHSLGSERFDQSRVGLHHICFRARSKDDVDRVSEFLAGLDATIIQRPQPGPWAPGYYSVLFEDPDGIRLEVNYVPGKGLQEEGVRFNPVSYK